MDFLSIVFRALYRVEVCGVDNLLNAGSNPIIALNHVSFLDAAVALSLLAKDPVFAIDSAMAKNWWVKPFLRIHPRHAARSDQADGDSHPDQCGEGRRAADHLPGGAITVTGSLMKVYDGAGLIADKTDAYVVPVRLDGP